MVFLTVISESSSESSNNRCLETGCCFTGVGLLCNNASNSFDILSSSELYIFEIEALLVRDDFLLRLA